MDFETIEKEILLNDTLDIYEKMCLLVLMVQKEDEVRLSSEYLSQLMGCGVNTAKRAFESLRLKGFLSKDYQANPPVSHDSNVLQTGADVSDITKVMTEVSDGFQEGFFKTQQPVIAQQPPREQPGKRHELDEQKKLMAEYILGPGPTSKVKPFVSQKETKQGLVDEVIALMEEKISFKEANILLAFANNDIERIKKQYKIAKMSQVSDTMSVLINALQKPEVDLSSIDSRVTDNTQVDTSRIRKMQAYQNMGTKK